MSPNKSMQIKILFFMPHIKWLKLTPSNSNSLPSQGWNLQLYPSSNGKEKLKDLTSWSPRRKSGNAVGSRVLIMRTSRRAGGAEPLRWAYLRRGSQIYIPSYHRQTDSELNVMTRMFAGRVVCDYLLQTIQQAPCPTILKSILWYSTVFLGYCTVIVTNTDTDICFES